MKSARNTIIALICLTAVLLVGVPIAALTYIQTTTKVVEQAQSIASDNTYEYRRDDYLVGLLSKVAKGDTSSMNVYYADIGQEAYATYHADVLAENNYLVTPSIRVSPAWDSHKYSTKESAEMVSVAHEYLHHAYYGLDGATRARLDSELMSLYSSDIGMQKRMESYINMNTFRATELFSIYCTESSDQYMTEFVLEKCNKHIDRSVLHLLR